MIKTGDVPNSSKANYIYTFGDEPLVDQPTFTSLQSALAAGLKELHASADDKVDIAVDYLNVGIIRRLDPQELFPTAPQLIKHAIDRARTNFEVEAHNLDKLSDAAVGQLGDLWQSALAHWLNAQPVTVDGYNWDVFETYEVSLLLDDTGIMQYFDWGQLRFKPGTYYFDNGPRLRQFLISKLVVGDKVATLREEFSDFEFTVANGVDLLRGLYNQQLLEQMVRRA